MNMTEVQRFTITTDQLAKRLVQLESEINKTKADINQLKKDASFDKKTNPGGIDKNEVKQIAGAAKIYAAANFEEKRDAANVLFAKYEELFDK